MGVFDWIATYVLCFFILGVLVECCRRLGIKEIHHHYHHYTQKEKETTLEEKGNDEGGGSKPSRWARVEE